MTDITDINACGYRRKNGMYGETVTKQIRKPAMSFLCGDNGKQETVMK